MAPGGLFATLKRACKASAGWGSGGGVASEIASKPVLLRLVLFLRLEQHLITGVKRRRGVG